MNSSFHEFFTPTPALNTVALREAGFGGLSFNSFNEYLMSNKEFRMSKCGNASLSLFY